MPETRLDAILTATRDRVASLRRHARELERLAAAAPEPRPFARALAGRDVGVIAEVKRRSPSAGAVPGGPRPPGPAPADAPGGGGGGSVPTHGPALRGALAGPAPGGRARPVAVL